MKLKLILILVLFAACALLGFFLAEQASVLMDQPGTSAPADVTSGSTFQQKVLLVVVDDLQTAQPQLVSAWAVIVTDTDPTNLTFKALFPGDNIFARDLSSSFKLEEHKLAPSFFRTLERLKIEWGGYLIVDYAGLKSIRDGGGGPQIELVSIVPQTPNEIQMILLQQTRFITEFCDTRAPEAVSTFSWSTLVPDHAVVEMPANNLMVLMSQLLGTGKAVRCEIIPLE